MAAGAAAGEQPLKGADDGPGYHLYVLKRRCGLSKPLDGFARRTDLPDGREYRCRRCDAARVSKYTRRKAAERKAAASGVSVERWE